MSTCRGKKDDGSPCKGKPRKGRRFCWFHDPKSAEARATAQANGGAESRNRVGPVKVLGKASPDVDVSGEEPIRALVKETIEQVRRGELSTHAAQVVGQLAAVALKALKQDETERKLAELDERTKPLADLTPEQLEAIVRQGHAATTPEGDPAH